MLGSFVRPFYGGVLHRIRCGVLRVVGGGRRGGRRSWFLPPCLEGTVKVCRRDALPSHQQCTCPLSSSIHVLAGTMLPIVRLKKGYQVKPSLLAASPFCALIILASFLDGLSVMLAAVIPFFFDSSKRFLF